MKILLAHNRYQIPGGEDEVFRSEAGLLRSAGQEVLEYVRDNDEIQEYGIWDKATLSLRTVWAWDSVRELTGILKREKPDVAHFHNTFPLISPAAYYACREASVPVVQTLHNPRLLCPAATLFREGHLCELCLGKSLPWPGVIHACYRRSRIQTSVVAGMYATHRWLGTWQNEVSIFICSTAFYRKKFTEGGLPAEKIALKPHFIAADAGVRQGSGTYALFIGRLAPEKGVGTLTNAWKSLKGRPIKIRGEGPLLPEVQNLRSQGGPEIDLVPRLERAELMNLIKGARFLVWPSLGYYETFGLVAVEAFACGVPVIASRIGVMEEIVQDGRTGLHFTPGDPEDLAAKVEWAWTHDQEMEEMGRNARAEYEAKYTAERNCEMLMGIYRQALHGRN